MAIVVAVGLAGVRDGDDGDAVDDDSQRDVVVGGRVLHAREAGEQQHRIVAADAKGDLQLAARQGGP